MCPPCNNMGHMERGAVNRITWRGGSKYGVGPNVLRLMDGRLRFLVFPALLRQRQRSLTSLSLKRQVRERKKAEVVATVKASDTMAICRSVLLSGGNGVSSWL